MQIEKLGLFPVAVADAKAEMVGFVVLAECTSLVGAAFKRSPSPTDPNETLLSFPTDRVLERQLCVVVGLVASRPPRACADRRRGGN